MFCIGRRECRAEHEEKERQRQLREASALVWDGGADINGTYWRRNLEWIDSNWTISFEELVARLITLSEQDPTTQTDYYKTSVEFVGTYKGEAFTIYDYKGDMQLHIGGTDRLDTPSLIQHLRDTLYTCSPTPYTAQIHYDSHAGEVHEWV
tara:strand:- start:1345 stop:1797 length:453 start_codon:yes stop_codon:yes gene_type:complete